MRHSYLVAALTLVACAQSPSSKPTPPGAQYFLQLQQARDLATRGQSAEAAELYERLTKIYPDDAETWMSLGNAHGKAQHYREAAKAYEQAIARGGEYPGAFAYRIARLYAQAGDKAQSLVWLERSLAIPLENRPRIASDDVFTAWRDDPQFRKLAGLAPVKSSLSRAERWNADLDFLAAEIRRLHYAYRGKPLSADFDGALRALRQRAPQLTDAAMEPEIQRLLAFAADGHTGLTGRPSLALPIAFYDFSDGMYVIDAVSECACIGERVVALNGVPIQSAVQKITPFLSVDNAMGVRFKAPIYLRYPDYLRAAGIASGDSIAVSLEGANGAHVFTAKASESGGVSGRVTVPHTLNQNYGFETLPGGDTIYFQFNQVLDEPANSIQQFAGKLHEALSPARIHNLIIDVRNNGGGNLDLFTPLLRTIITFQTTHAGAGIYVLTSRQTFSAAQVFVNQLDRNTSAIVAGEPAGSRPNFIGESAPTVLPYSGLYMTISTRYHQTDDQDQRTWIAPKIPVALTSADYFAKRDPVLDAVLAVIARGGK